MLVTGVALVADPDPVIGLNPKKKGRFIIAW
jgi:hypothetical protein